MYTAVGAPNVVFYRKKKFGSIWKSKLLKIKKAHGWEILFIVTVFTVVVMANKD